MCIRDSYKPRISKFQPRGWKLPVSYTHLDVYKRQLTMFYKVKVVYFSQDLWKTLCTIVFAPLFKEFPCLCLTKYEALFTAITSNKTIKSTTFHF